MPVARATLYKSHVLWDKAESLGYPFVMYYNAKQQGPWIERIGMAVSRDMVHWSRYGHAPVIDNGTGISGDPQIVRMGGAWVTWDKTYAHKPWVPKHDGVVYHFYCAVGTEGRVLAVATSRDLRAARHAPGGQSDAP